MPYPDEFVNILGGKFILEGDVDSTVPTVFKWDHGGKEVSKYIHLVVFLFR